MDCLTPPISILCITEARPHFQAHMLEQYFNVSKILPEHELVVVTSCEDIETLQNITVTACGKHGIRPQEIELITREFTKKSRGTRRITIDSTLPPVKSGYCTMGEKRNQAMKLSRFDHITWIDDDDLQHDLRIFLVDEVGRWAARAKKIEGNEYSVVVRGNAPLLHIFKERIANNTPRSHQWYQGIYYKPHAPEFDAINIGEDHYWTKQFLAEEEGDRVVVIGPPPIPLSVNVKHYENISFVSKMSESSSRWAFGALPQYLDGGDGWTGVRALQKMLKVVQRERYEKFCSNPSASDEM